MRSNRWQTLGICALLLLAVGLVFAQTVDFDFINLDDNVGVYENSHVTHGLTWDSVKWAFQNRLNCNWDPLTWISHTLDWQLYGRNAGWHHLTNVLLHGATVVLLFLVLRQMSAAVWPSAVAAALFAIHPLRAESVVWVTERKDVLSGLFFTLILAAYVSYAHRGSIWRYLLVMVLFAIGLLSKPVLVTVPFLLLLLDYWPLGRIRQEDGADVPVCRDDCDNSGRQESLPRRLPLWRLIVEKIPLLILAAACCGFVYWAERVAEYPHRGAYWRIGNALISYVVYLRQFFWPSDLALLYPRRGSDLPLWQVVGAGLIVLAITAAVIIRRRKHPCLLVGWFWYLAMMLPMIGLVAFGNEAPADRFTYLPQIGIAVALAWWAAECCWREPYRRWIYGIASVLALLVLMGLAFDQVSYWRNSETLWRRTLACTSDNYWVHNLLGNALGAQGRDDEARSQFLAAVRLKPDYADAYYNLGVAAAHHGELDRAMVYYEKAAKLDRTSAKARNNLGYSLLLSGEYYEAVKQFEGALKINPEFAPAHYNHGLALHALGKINAAIVEYRTALEIQPEYAEAYYNLGIIYAARGQRDDAATCYRAALKIKPDFPEVKRSLKALAAQRGP
jgi:tetratricopeptide (TPR) repeat protein